MRDSLASHLDRRFVRFVDSATRRIYLATDGRIGHKQMGWTFLVLTTIGRKTGRPHTHTLAYLKHGDQLLIAASNNGADRHPAWYINLLANPRVHVQYGRERGDFVARTASPEERRELWPKLVAYHAPYRHHQERTQREIPVVILTPIAPRQGS